MNDRPFQRCTRCVMDTTDSKITFDENGVCDHCRNFDKNIAPYWKPNENRIDELQKLAEKIRKAGKNNEYDCILGLSGGADSSYLAYVAKEIMHLRPLAFVVDTGWNLNVAVENIEKIVKGLGLDIVYRSSELERNGRISSLLFLSQVYLHKTFHKIMLYLQHSIIML